MSGADYRTLPHSDEAERAILGGVILSKTGTLAKVAAIVCGNDFYREKHRIIFAACNELEERGLPIDLITLRDELDRMGRVEAVGGMAYVSSFIDGTARSANVEYYARIVKEKADRRAVIREAHRIVHVASGGSSQDELTRAIEDAHPIFHGAVASSRAGTPPSIALDTVAAEEVEYAVQDFFRRKGVAIVYGKAGAGKTFLLLDAATELLAATGPSEYGRAELLFGDPELTIRRPWRRVVCVSAEETAGILRSRWDRVLAGRDLKPEDIRGELTYLWPFDKHHTITLDRAEDIIDAAPGKVDVLIFDSWTSLVPGTFEGRTIEWDKDNYATRRLINVLRDVAERRDVLIIVVHHSGHDSSHVRGPSEALNSIDTLLKLEKRPERRIKITVEKQRDGRDDWGPTVAMEFTRDAVRIRHEERPSKKLTEVQQAVYAYLQGAQRASVAQICKALGRAPSSVQRALVSLCDARLVFDTKTRGAHNSAIYEVTQLAQTDAVPSA